MIPDEALKHFRKGVDLGKKVEEEWNNLFEAYAKKHPQEAKELQQIIKGELPAGWDKDIPVFPADSKGLATRAAAGKVMQAIFPHLPTLNWRFCRSQCLHFHCAKGGRRF